jgi:uncharacterized integral membrane protein
MSDLWLKIKLWTKVIVTSAVALYFLIFLGQNHGHPVDVWFWFSDVFHTSVLRLIFYVFVGGIVTAFMTQTTVKTLYQFRTLRAKAATARAEQQLADLKAQQAAAQTSSTDPAKRSNPSRNTAQGDKGPTGVTEADH